MNLRFRQAAPSARFLHLATHGFFRAIERHVKCRSSANGACPGRSQLPCSSREGRRHLHGAGRGGTELERRRVGCPVRLRNGIGQEPGGEGILGLQRAFQVAGCKTTITSLWQVHDEATQTLMAEFYRNLWIKKLGKLESLRSSTTCDAAWPAIQSSRIGANERRSRETHTATLLGRISTERRLAITLMLQSGLAMN